jgi:hypothetical protein
MEFEFPRRRQRMDLKEEGDTVKMSHKRRWTTAENLDYFSKVVESLPGGGAPGDTIKLMGEIFFHDSEEDAGTSSTNSTSSTRGDGGVITTVLQQRRDLSQKIPRGRPRLREVKEKNFRVIRPERDGRKRQRLENEITILRLLMQLAEYALSGRSFHISEISRVVRGTLGGNTIELRPIPLEFQEVLRGDACLTTFMRILITHPPSTKHEDAWITSRYAVSYVAPHFFSPWHYQLWVGICSGDMDKFKKFVMEENTVESHTDRLAKLLSITTYVFDQKTN